MSVWRQACVRIFILTDIIRLTSFAHVQSRLILRMAIVLYSEGVGPCYSFRLFPDESARIQRRKSGGLLGAMKDVLCRKNNKLAAYHNNNNNNNEKHKTINQIQSKQCKQHTIATKAPRRRPRSDSCYIIIIISSMFSSMLAYYYRLLSSIRISLFIELE